MARQHGIIDRQAPQEGAWIMQVSSLLLLITQHAAMPDEACQLLVDTLSLLGWDAFPSLG